MRYLACRVDVFIVTVVRYHVLLTCIHSKKDIDLYSSVSTGWFTFCQKSSLHYQTHIYCILLSML